MALEQIVSIAELKLTIAGMIHFRKPKHDPETCGRNKDLSYVLV